MRKKLVVLCGFSAVFLCLVAWLALRPQKPEPIYGGKLESYWVDLLASPTAFLQASQKVGISQTDLQSIFLKGLDRRANPVSRAYLRFWPKLPTRLKNCLPRPIDSAVVRKNAAIFLSGDPDYKILDRVLKNHPDAQVRLWIVVGLEQRPDNDSTLALIEAIDDKDPQVREEAVLACSVVRRDTDLTVLAAKKALKNIDPKIRCYGILIPNQLLDTYRLSEGSIERSMSPDLVKALKDSDLGVRDLATNLLFRIAPIELANAEGKSQVTISSMIRGENLSSQTALHDFSQINSNTPGFLKYGAGLMLSMANDLREKWGLDCPPLTTNNVKFDLNMTEGGVGGKLYSRPERFTWTFQTNTLCEMVDMDNSPRYFSDYSRARANSKTNVTTNRIDRRAMQTIARDYLTKVGVPAQQLPPATRIPTNVNFRNEFLFYLSDNKGRARFYISEFTGQVAEYQGTGACALHQPLPPNYLQMLETTSGRKAQ